MQINKDTIKKALAPLSARWRAQQQLKKTKPTEKSSIETFPGEREILRKPTLLVTDTRLAYIDPYNRKLKTYMFEHMISVSKDFYKPTDFMRGFCKALIFTGILLLLITLIVDLLDNNSRGFMLVYIPALLSLIVGLLVWRDMRPKYKVEWKMRDGSTDKIATELMFSAWLMNDKHREAGMNDIIRAINEGLSNKAWWPAKNSTSARSEMTGGTAASYGSMDQQLPTNESAQPDQPVKQQHLKLVTENYQ